MDPRSYWQIRRQIGADEYWRDRDQIRKLKGNAVDFTAPKQSGDRQDDPYELPPSLTSDQMSVLEAE